MLPALFYEEMKKSLEFRFEGKSDSNRVIGRNEITDLQKKIPSDSVIWYISRNENDILCWIIKQGSIQPIRLAGAVKQTDEILVQYSQAVQTMQSSFGATSKLETVFGQVLKNIKTAKDLYIIADSYSTKIPFETIGKDQMLIDQHGIYYAESLSSIAVEKSKNRPVCVITGNAGAMDSIDQMAIHRSGIKVDLRNGNYIHLIGGSTDTDEVLTRVNRAVIANGGR